MPTLSLSKNLFSDLPSNSILDESKGINTLTILIGNLTKTNANYTRKWKDKSTLPVINPNLTGSACLYISDETIRLTE